MSPSSLNSASGSASASASASASRLSTLNPQPYSPAVARISRRQYRGELYYSARIFLDNRPILHLDERPNALAVLLDVLDWSQRHGKDLVWQYQDLLI